MSIYKRARRRQFQRGGGASFDAPNGTLPTAQERVQQAIESAALDGWGYGGEPPMQGPPGVWEAPVAPNGPRPGARPRRLKDLRWPSPRRLLPSPAKRLSKRQQYKALSTLQIRAPRATLFCQQRRERKEVLFAKKIAGFKRSPGRGGTYRRRPESQWRC